MSESSVVEVDPAAEREKVLQEYLPALVDARVDQQKPGAFDTLARAKQSLAVHPRLAWLLVDEFREAWNLPTVSPD